ncbi:hypothetical protein L596_018508 [Steinernema carpocapsae]|uniref:Uncharacterized protein n=1 Tax=Steinernema carpocapsae TaxID=34508 RepID=A0A4U5N572_STECR|nr:hypothetical protein L596_018508 [Steinernema carpocapsae]
MRFSRYKRSPHFVFLFRFWVILLASVSQDELLWRRSTGAPQQQPSAEYVPAPTQFGNLVEMPGANPQMRTPLNQELTIAKLENTMASMEDQHLTNDPRYQQIARLKQRITGQPLPTQGDSTNPATPANGSTEDDGKGSFSAEQLQQLKAQVDVYKLLARQETVPAALSNAAIRLKPTSNLPEPYECAGESETGDKIPYDMIKVFQIHSSRSNARRSTLITPTGIDPQYILKERENRLQNRIGCRIRDLASLPAAMPPHLSVKAEIELRALRLVNFQQQMRREVLGQLKRDSMMETALNPHAYRRTKTQSLREARITEKLEKQQKIEQEKRRRQQHMELLQAILQQGKEFKEFHRNNQIKNGKLKKAVLTYHANTERERRKDEQKNEKLRMMKLIQEDEEGYRQLLDEKKDQRLVYLLQQTDEFIGSLTGLVKAHQATEKTRKSSARKDELRKQMEGRTPVRNMTTGKILYGDRAPKTEELDGWMAANPGFEVCSLDDVEDSGDEDDINETVPEEKEDKDDELEGLDEEQRNKKIIEKARNEEDEYDEKTKHKLESYYATAHRIREKIVKQHSTMGGGNPELKLKPYQIKGLEWMVSLYNNNLNGILADEMGLGKTIQTVALITYLMEVKKVNGPYLVIVPLSTISNWALELEKWAPNVHKIVYKGDRDARKRLDISIRRGSFNVLLTTYDYVLKEKALLGKLQWKYMIIDEGHRMKNHNCKLSLILNKEFNAQHRILLTGTPLQNKLPELWALLNFLLPSIFSSCHTFEQWFNAPFATTGEKVELNQEETMLIIRRLHKVLRPFLLRRLKKEVESQLPDKTEHLLKCDMSALQKILYRSMQKGFLIDQRNVNGTRALANTLMHLRKLCNHPFLFESVESNCKDFWGLDHITGKELYRVSGKFELLDRILPKLKTSGHRVLIFCQMTSLMNVMEDYFLYRQWKYLRLDGSTKPDDRGELLKMYNAPNSEYFIFMLSTRAGGLGLNLQTADTVIIFDSDWNPHQDMQAQDRAHRIGQKREVRVFRLITVNSVEERILAAAKYKLNMDSKVIQAGKFDQRSTGAERRQMLERIIQEDQSDDEDEDDVPDDDAINEMLAREQKELDLFMRMDIERRRAEAEEDPRNRKPRLVEENEIPDTIIKFDEKFQQNEDMGGETSIVDMALESGRRRRREVDYSADLMSEQEFMRQLEDEEDEDASRSSSKRSRKSEKGTPGRSKRKRVELDDDDDEDSRAGGETPSRKRKKGPNNELADLVNRCIKGLVEYTSSSGRRIAEVFESLPSRRELPDYYEIIDRPMDIKRIQRKLADGRYSSIDDVTNDVRLLGSNARKYNQDGSDIYNDSLLLEAVWKQLVDNIERPASSASTQNSSSGDVTPGGSGELRRKRLKDE